MFAAITATTGVVMPLISGSELDMDDEEVHVYVHPLAMLWVYNRQTVFVCIFFKI